MWMYVPLRRWLLGFLPHPIAVGPRERFRACAGALLGLAIAGAMLPWLPAFRSSLPMLIAPMGASTVLLFAVPSSPLAQPWSVVGGNLVAAAVGVTAAAWVPDLALAGAIAVAVAIGLMFALRCIHPPSGAVALTAVFGGPAIHAMGYRFLFFPVAVESAVLVAIALIYHAATGHRYPHAWKRPAPATLPGNAPSQQGFVREDIEAVLKRRGEMLDIDIDDLEALMRDTQLQAYSRGFTGMRCEDIMSAPVVTISRDASTLSALRLLRRHKVKALPVVDEAQRLLGIVTRADLVPFPHAGLSLARADAAVRWLKRRGRADQCIGSVMTTNVCSIRMAAPLADLVPLFTHSGHHHIPVLDAESKVVGMITESDLVSGLHRETEGLQRRAA